MFGFIGLVAVSVAFISLRSAQFNPPQVSQPTLGVVSAQISQSYLVQEGDSLWSIASNHVEGDPREMVAQLIALNGSAEIEVGQVVLIPGV